MYQFLLHAHSVFRWFVLPLLIASVVFAVVKRSKKENVAEKKVYLYTLMFTHFQLIFGIILFFISPKVIFSAEAFQHAMTRFFLAEHSVIMLIAITLITIGYVRHKKASAIIKARNIILWFYLMGLVLILVGIPWPFRGFGSGWF